MSILLNFVIGFFAAFVGVVPPGLLNMSAAKISMKEGRKVAFLFSVGICITVMLQTFVALLFAKYIDSNRDIVDVLQKVGLGIFFCLTIYFFFIAKDTRREMPEGLAKSKTNRFFSGMLIAVLNLLPLPYWIYVSISFATFGLFQFSQPELLVAVIASGLGTFAMLAIYVQFFKRNEETKKGFKINMNYIIGLITAAISVITAFKVLNDF